MQCSSTLLLSLALAGTIGLAASAKAQYKPTGDDGITASPRVRQMLNERATSRRATPQAPAVTVRHQSPGLKGVAASPKVHQMLAERKGVVGSAVASEVAVAGYQATGSDGITASPKLRQQLNQSGRRFMIAPLK